jgi:phage terminase Nu1 subunit (DNA packaging protein)
MERAKTEQMTFLCPVIIAYVRRGDNKTADGKENNKYEDLCVPMRDSKEMNTSK